MRHKATFFDFRDTFIVKKCSNFALVMIKLCLRSLLATIVTAFAACFNASANESAMPFTIVIDAGHGGRDFGCRGDKEYEKNITLDVAKRLKTLISQSG